MPDLSLFHPACGRFESLENTNRGPTELVFEVIGNTGESTAVGAKGDDLAAVEKAEIDIIQEYLPEALSEDEINELVEQTISATGAATIKDMGKLMGALKPQLQGRADMGKVSQLIKSRLSA